MKQLTIVLIAAMVVIMSACEKQETKPSNTRPTIKLLDCKGCEGSWDLTDTALVKH